MFFGLMSVKKHKAAMKHSQDLFDVRGKIIDDRDIMIGRLQRTSEDMLARNLELQAKVQRLEAELAPLKAERDKRLAILSAANEARRLKAQQKAAA